MAVSADFLIQAILVAAAGLVFLLAGIRTLRADRHVYNSIRRRTGSGKKAAAGTVGHHTADADATVIHGMAIGERDGKYVIVRNGKIASDSISAC